MFGICDNLINARGLLHIRVHRIFRACRKRDDVPSWLRDDWRGMFSYRGIANPIWFSRMIALYILALT